MKFEEYTIEEIMQWPDERRDRAICAHGMQIHGMKFPKGSPLSLLFHNIDLPIDSAVWLAEPDDNDWGEQKICDYLAPLLNGQNMRSEITKTGRVNFYATNDGLLAFDAPNCHQANGLSEHITLAILPPFQMVRRGQLCASLKILPYFVDENLVRQFGQLARQVQCAVHGFMGGRVHLLMTMTDDKRPEDYIKSAIMVQDKLQIYGYKTTTISYCRHDMQEICQKLTIKGEFDVVCVMGAVAISDRADIVPRALCQLGGTIERFGMPMDPGNLLLLGKLGGAHFLGLPGCAKSRKLNGLDFILMRLSAGLNPTSQQIAQMGVNGILPEDFNRGALRAQKPAIMSQPLIAIMAAGLGRRMGGDIAKPLVIFRDKPLIQWVIEACMTALPKAEIIVIINSTGQGKKIEEFCKTLGVNAVENPQYAEGMASSLRLASHLALERKSALMVFCADMPNITPPTIEKIWREFQSSPTICAVQPKFGESFGHPVVLSPRLFAQIAEIQGDMGARQILQDAGEHRKIIEVLDAGILQDIDNRAMIHHWSRDYDIVFADDLTPIPSQTETKDMS